MSTKDKDENSQTHIDKGQPFIQIQRNPILRIERS